MPKLKQTPAHREGTVEEYLAAQPSKPRRGPVWAGPCGAGSNGGVTQSLISRFLVCRERFRLLVVEGLKPADVFNARLEMGNMWHAAEEAFAARQPWELPLREYVKTLTRKYPLQQDQVIHWYDVCRATFPEYVEHWSRNDDVKARTPLMAEQEFDVPYALPSGRVVRLRGKWDSVELVGKGKAARVWLMENKTKSAIDDVKVARQLTFDLQTMLYTVALIQDHNQLGGAQPGHWDWMSDAACRNIGAGMFAGVRYNVIRRSGHKSTSADARKHPDGFVGHLRDMIRADVAENPKDNGWFARWKVAVGPTDVAKFRRECLDPILEQLCAWWEWVEYADDPFSRNEDMSCAPKHAEFIHWRHPFGVWNVLDEGGSSDLDSYLIDGSIVGLQTTNSMFPELGGKTA